jgi:RNA polymerase sigma factor (sigma-70 family)
MAGDQDRRIADVVGREQARLRSFIRRRVGDPRDVEDILQDVFSELVEANQLLMPIEHVTGWLFRVARNRIIDLFRKKRPDPLADEELLLPSLDDGPAEALEHSELADALAEAIAELSDEQREVFVAHEIDGKSFKEISADTGVGVNTLLSRKRYAVQHLRKRLQRIHDERSR